MRHKIQIEKRNNKEEDSNNEKVIGVSLLIVSRFTNKDVIYYVARLKYIIIWY